MRRLDLAGKRFGRLTAIRYAGSYNGQAIWQCRCDCGKEKEIKATCLVRPKFTKSCGCLAVELKIASHEELTGMIFGRLTALEYVGNATWKCRCECGKETLVPSGRLKTKTRSCGCLARENASRLIKELHITGGKTIHGLTGIPEHAVWASMISRCTNPRSTAYKNYGGRGISVCARWMKFSNFIADMQRRPSDDHEIERRDNNGNYCPENCYWATRAEQAANKRTNRMLTFNGRTMHQAAWVREIGIEVRTLHRRLSNGWSVEKALSTPLLRQGNKFEEAK